MPATWGTFVQTLARYQHGGWHGLGFVFSAADPYCGIDLDHCRDPETGEMAYWAQQIVDALDSYTEVSPSGRGVHILLRATLPDHVGRKQGAVEVYSTERYFTVTGEHLPRMPPKLEERQAETLTLYATLAHEEGRTRSQPQRGPARHLAARMPRCSQRRWPPPMARRFRRSGRAICLPIVTHQIDQSRADFNLCLLLAYWSDSDADQIDRLFRQSSLYRPKWDAQFSGHGRTYGEVTIWNAIRRHERLCSVAPAVRRP